MSFSRSASLRSKTTNGHAKGVNQAWNMDEPEPLDEEPSRWMSAVGSLQTSLSALGQKYNTAIQAILIAGLVVLVHVYVVFACIHDVFRARFVLGVVCIGWLWAIYSFIYLRFLHDPLMTNVFNPFLLSTQPIRDNRVFQIGLGLVVLVGIGVFLIIDTWKEQRRLIGLGGMACFIIIMFICSNNRMKIRWRPVLWGYLMQFVLGMLVLRWEWGKNSFLWFSDQVVTFLDYTNNGTRFVYGFLAEPPNICGMTGVFAFTALQVVVYFGSIVALLYYYGIMQAVLRKMAFAMQITLGTTATESLNACACIFLGQSEAPLLIRPYLSRMTASELHAVMTSGFSCIAGSLFAAYIAFGACPAYLLSSTVMSAPGSLACSKILFPETEESQLVDIDDLELAKGEESTPLECISNGAVAAVELVQAIVANLIVFLALLAFIDNVFDYIGWLIGYEGWTFQLLLGYIFFPIAYVMGVTENSDQTLKVARLMGTKTALNEFIAYQQLGDFVAQNALSPRSAMIATYALCGFSNFSSIGIQLGVLGGMVPERKPLLARIALRALLAGCISCFFTASLAGVLVQEPLHCDPKHANANCFNVTYYQDLLNKTLPSEPLPQFFSPTVSPFLQRSEL